METQPKVEIYGRMKLTHYFGNHLTDLDKHLADFGMFSITGSKHLVFIPA